MTIQIELTPEEEAQLRQQAQARGETPEVWAGEMLRTQLRAKSGAYGESGEHLPVLDEQGVFHPERLEAAMRRIVRRTGVVPHLPREALTRESMYQDAESPGAVEHLHTAAGE
jgi:hypothetical protein